MIPKAMFVIGLACAAYGQDVPAPATPLEWGKPSGGLRLSLTSNKAGYGPGETVRVTAILKNVSDAPIWVGSTSVWQFYEMEVLAPAPEWLPFRPRASRTPLGERNLHLEVRGMGGRRLSPDLETRHEFELDTLFQMTDPGQYRITFAYYKGPIGDRSHADIRVVSNELKVTILASPE
jgi:hypothetical protein